MTSVTCQLSISLDGYVAGPGQSEDEPLGVGGMRLHDWFFNAEGRQSVDAEIAERILEGNGAYVMGRRMFGGGPGPWDLGWRGWWGADPPYHAPVFVLTHEPRPPLELDGGTTFHFVTEGLGAALERARVAAGPDLDVCVAGGASTANQALAAGLLDELFLHVVPIVLGDGERLLVDVGDPMFEPVEVVHSPAVTHVRYRIVR